MTPTDLADLRYMASGIRHGIDANSMGVVEHYADMLDTLIRDVDPAVERVVAVNHEISREERP